VTSGLTFDGGGLIEKDRQSGVSKLSLLYWRAHVTFTPCSYKSVIPCRLGACMTDLASQAATTRGTICPKHTLTIAIVLPVLLVMACSFSFLHKEANWLLDISHRKPTLCVTIGKTLTLNISRPPTFALYQSPCPSQRLSRMNFPTENQNPQDGHCSGIPPLQNRNLLTWISQLIMQFTKRVTLV